MCMQLCGGLTKIGSVRCAFAMLHVLMMLTRSYEQVPFIPSQLCPV